MVTIEITKEFLETYGTASLQGTLASLEVYDPTLIVLRFPQTSYSWRKANGGPDIYMMPEFVPFCLLESVLTLMSRGYTFRVEWYCKDSV